MFYFPMIFSVASCFKYTGKQICYDMKKTSTVLQVQMTLSNVENGNYYGAFGIGSAMKGDVFVVWSNSDNIIRTSNRVATGYALTTFKNNSNLQITFTRSNATMKEIHFQRPLKAIGGFTAAVDTYFMCALSIQPVNTTDPEYEFEKHDYAANFRYFMTSTDTSPNKSDSLANSVSWLVSAAVASKLMF